MQGSGDPRRMEDDALVLNSTESGESDLILTLLSRNHGRFSAIAKGARRSKKRFVNKLELFTLLQITVSRKTPTALAFLHEAELVTIYPTLRTDCNAYLGASLLCEFLLHATRDSENDPRLFRLSLWGLYQLDQGRPPAEPVALFLLSALTLLGYRPELHHCMVCGRIASELPVRFEASEGGLICSSCNGGRIQTPLSAGCLGALTTAQNTPLNRLARLRPSHAVLRESLQLLHSFSRHLLQRELNCWPAFSAACLQQRRR